MKLIEDKKSTNPRKFKSCSIRRVGNNSYRAEILFHKENKPDSMNFVGDYEWAKDKMLEQIP